MPRVGPHIVARPDRLHTRRCLSCGYGGPELQGDRGRTAFRCPACAEDLYARPARTYYEMEGFDAEHAPLRVAPPATLRHRLRRAHAGMTRLRRHWLAQLLGRGVVLTATLALLALVIVLAGEFAAAP